jgi:hypothetical protein
LMGCVEWFLELCFAKKSGREYEVSGKISRIHWRDFWSVAKGIS